jgi:tRNA pseudouridine55 synthase
LAAVQARRLDHPGARLSALNGWIALDKPEGIGSARALAAVKRLVKAEKAGHAGTLDPLASGLLPIALGEATKTVAYAMDGRKTYRFTIAWGAETATDDRESAPVKISNLRPDRAAITGVLENFRGTIAQTPPAFSALKIAGERAYHLARAGERPELEPRQVTIERLDLLEIPDADHAVFEADCGKGTYIRALARDIGRALGCLGHLASLRRTAVGPFREADMIPLDKLAALCHKAPGEIATFGFLRPLETVLDGIPALAVSGEQAQRLRLGQSVLLRGANAPVATDAVLVTTGGRPVGLASIEQGSLKPKRLFNLD